MRFAWTNLHFTNFTGARRRPPCKNATPQRQPLLTFGLFEFRPNVNGIIPSIVEIDLDDVVCVSLRHAESTGGEDGVAASYANCRSLDGRWDERGSKVDQHRRCKEKDNASHCKESALVDNKPRISKKSGAYGQGVHNLLVLCEFLEK